MSEHPDMRPDRTTAEKPSLDSEAAGQHPAWSKRTLKRFFVALIGGTVVLLGIAMILLPGPAFIVIPAGLAILATEFLWARRALHKCQRLVGHVRRKPWLRLFKRRESSTGTPPERV